MSLMFTINYYAKLKLISFGASFFEGNNGILTIQFHKILVEIRNGFNSF